MDNINMSDFSQINKLDIESSNLYERVGGEKFFVKLVNKFYEYVEADKILRAIYPKDLNPGKSHLTSFLCQYWGGPNLYSIERGHPRLRKRHINFTIGQRERDTWVEYMCLTLKTMDLSCNDLRTMINYFQKTATMMINN